MAGSKPAGAQEQQEGPQPDVEGLEAALAQAQARVAELEATSAPGGDRLADVLERLGTQLADRGVEQATFKPDDRADDIMASLEGRVSVGDHSGRFTEGGPRVFLARGRNLRIIKKARIRYSDARGEVVVTEGIHYPFEPDGRFETDDMAVVEYLESRPAFGVEFWEMGHDPHVAPNPQPVLDTIMDAMLEFDDERLARIEQEELDGLKREVVLSSVASARRKVQGLAAPAEDDAAEVPA